VKKNSKVDVKEEMSLVEAMAQELTIGIDLGDRNSSYCVLDAEGEVVTHGSFKTEETGLRIGFQGMPPARIVMEAGTHSRWVSHCLEDWGHEVIVAQPRKLRLIYGDHTKNDQLDAEKLARLARADERLLYPIKHRGEEVQADLSFVRGRVALVETRTKLINTVRGLAKSSGQRVPACSSEVFTERARESLSEELLIALVYVLAGIDALSEQIRFSNECAEHLVAEKYPETARLKQVPGVGTVTALTYVLTIEDAERFEKSRDVGCYLGLRPRQDQSGDSNPQLRITKAGDAYLRCLLVNCSHWILGAFGPDTDLRRWGLGLCERGGKNARKRAIVAVARKLSVLLHSLWKSGEEYEPLRNSKRKEAAEARKAAAMTA
jgi:transposase